MISTAFQTETAVPPHRLNNGFGFTFSESNVDREAAEEGQVVK